MTRNQSERLWILQQQPKELIQLIISKEELKNIENKMNELLSDLELEVLELYLSGKSYQYIANMLNRDVKSIDNAL